LKTLQKVENFSRKPLKEKSESGQKELAVPTAFPLANNITAIFSLIQQGQKVVLSLAAAAKRHFSFIFIYSLSGDCGTNRKIVNFNFLSH